MKCLANTPARTPAAIAAGAKSRYDDFVVTHIIQSLTNHGTANFLSWHRYYLLAFEDILRDECGLTGYQPYVNFQSGLMQITSDELLQLLQLGMVGRRSKSLAAFRRQ